MNERQELIDCYLARRSRANRDAVIAAHMYLCRRGARKFRRPESDPADLEQVAAIGLVKATTSYAAERGTPFEAYAWLIIVGELMHYVRDCERVVRAPRWMRSLDREYVRVWEDLAARRHAEPTVPEIACALGVPVATIEELRALRRSRFDAAGDERDPFEAIPSSASGLTVDERLTVLAAVEQLDPREQVIVLGTFAAGLSQHEVGRRLGISQSQVSKLLSRALGKLLPAVA